jgi:hypothetical protein
MEGLVPRDSRTNPYRPCQTSCSWRIFASVWGWKRSSGRQWWCKYDWYLLATRAAYLLLLLLDRVLEVENSPRSHLAIPATLDTLFEPSSLDRLLAWKWLPCSVDVDVDVPRVALGLWLAGHKDEGQDVVPQLPVPRLPSRLGMPTCR